MATELRNKYRTKCPAPLTVAGSTRYQPYQRPAYSMPQKPMTPSSYVPTPPCPAPGTWANTFSYDDYSTKVWANDVSHQQRVYLQYHSARLQADIMGSQYPSCAYTPKTPSVPFNNTIFYDRDNIAVSMMREEADCGHLSSTIISRVSPDGDICDDVLDADNCLPDTSGDAPHTPTEMDGATVPSGDSPVVFMSSTMLTPPAPLMSSTMIAPPEPLMSSTMITPPTPVMSTPPAAVTPVVKRDFIRLIAETPSKLVPVLPPTPRLTVPEVPSMPAPATSSTTKKTSKKAGRHECKTCGKVFGWRTGLMTHQRLHTGERPYACPACPKSFTDYSTFTKHCRIHSGDKPYCCDICGKAFTQSGNRLRHMRTVHKNKTQ